MAGVFDPAAALREVTDRLNAADEILERMPRHHAATRFGVEVVKAVSGLEALAAAGLEIRSREGGIGDAPARKIDASAGALKGRRVAVDPDELRAAARKLDAAGVELALVGLVMRAADVIEDDDRLRDAAHGLLQATGDMGVADWPNRLLPVVDAVNGLARAYFEHPDLAEQVRRRRAGTAPTEEAVGAPPASASSSAGAADLGTKGGAVASAGPSRDLSLALAYRLQAADDLADVAFEFITAVEQAARIAGIESLPGTATEYMALRAARGVYKDRARAHGRAIAREVTEEIEEPPSSPWFPYPLVEDHDLPPGTIEFRLGDTSHRFKIADGDEAEIAVPPETLPCARDSGWCDGVLCRERGIDCPNADPPEEPVSRETPSDRPPICPTCGEEMQREPQGGWSCGGKRGGKPAHEVVAVRDRASVVSPEYARRVAEEHAASQSSHSPLPPLKVAAIKHPPCPECGAEMKLASAEGRTDLGNSRFAEEAVEAGETIWICTGNLDREERKGRPHPLVWCPAGPPPLPGDDWRCADCGEENPDVWARCSTCGRARDATPFDPPVEAVSTQYVGVRDAVERNETRPATKEEALRDLDEALARLRPDSAIAREVERDREEEPQPLHTFEHDVPEGVEGAGREREQAAGSEGRCDEPPSPGQAPSPADPPEPGSAEQYRRWCEEAHTALAYAVKRMSGLKFNAQLANRHLARSIRRSEDLEAALATAIDYIARNVRPRSPGVEHIERSLTAILNARPTIGLPEPWAETLPAAFHTWRRECMNAAREVAVSLAEADEDDVSPGDMRALVDRLAPTATALVSLLELEHGCNEPDETPVDEAMTVLNERLGDG